MRSSGSPTACTRKAWAALGAMRWRRVVCRDAWHRCLQARPNSISPAMTAIRLNDDTAVPSGCRSPAALHLDSSGDTPNPFGSPATSVDGPAKSPTSAAQASASRARGRQGGNLATRALSSLNPARASGVIGNIFGGGRSGRDGEDDARKQPDASR